MYKTYMAKSKDLGDDQCKISFMNELIDVGHQTAGEAKDILWFLASD